MQSNMLPYSLLLFFMSFYNEWQHLLFCLCVGKWADFDMNEVI